MKKLFEDMECEDLKPYCPWEGSPVTMQAMCEGRYCKEAFDGYLEDEETDEDE